MKINETMFRPLIFVIFEWVNISVDQDDKQESRESIPPTEKGPLVSTRTLVFYHMIFSLTDHLQGIFVPYYQYLVGHMTQILSVSVKKNPHGQSILRWILQSLTSCFIHDSGSSFMNAKIFEKLLAPLCSVLDRVEPTKEEYCETIQQYLVPCLGHLTVVLGHEDLWKSLNHQVLLRTRSENSSVRWASLCVIHGFYLRQGESFLPLLPESMQFIYELMEDEDPEVEALTGKLKKTLEDILGKEAFEELLR
eukprot:TRINITY_DN8211_c0_g1_i7.p1 TRINITY_DN8211_c0_g1~~TRINITY_DN8211_c0_g1_i7.p1  ORF type:complete len:251 (-),score=47.97 TRINITY_DN8211_c0_g1_i7:143-895(-)